MLEGLDVKNEGTWIWRVDQWRLVEIPKPSHGTFCTGDSYVVLYTFRTESGINHRLYSWQGQESSPDEKATSILLAQKLNEEELGGTAELVREEQHKESEEFRQLFSSGLNFKAGGVPSGLRHAAQAAKEQDQAKLFIIKSPSRTSVQVVEVAPSLQSLMSNASFVLDAPGRKTLYVWHGNAANLREKSKSLEVANTFRSNRGFMRLTFLDQGDSSGEDASTFFHLLGEPHAAAAASRVQPSDQSPVSVAASNPAAAAAAFSAPRLFVLEHGRAPTEIPGPPSRSSLRTEGQVGLVVNGRVWVWTGAKAPAPTQEQGAQVAAAAGLPTDAPVSFVREHLEPGIFMAHFHDWNDSQYAAFQAYQASKAMPDSFGAAASSPAKQQPQMNAEGVTQAMVKDAQAARKAAPQGSGKGKSSEGRDGKLTVWVVRGNNLVELPPSERGHFFDGDAYVVLHEYILFGEERQTIYFWIGRHATNLEGGTAAVLATEMYNTQFKGTAALCRVAQNSEPSHFAAVFGPGSLVIHSGERPEHGGCLPQGARLYKLKAESAESLHAVQVDLTASSLNSGDSFVLKGPSEGEEPAEFWALLGGRSDYPHSNTCAPLQSPVLFHLRDTAAAGGIKVEANATFSQEDLSATDAMILDPGVGNELFVWCGREASEFERPRAHKVAEAYSQAKGQESTSIVDVQDGAEPPFFTQHFLAWDNQKRATIPDVYKEKLKQQEAAKQEESS
ncbi:actin-binding protein gelsolin [Dunaliella salina]|uniref:Actin-binding protein gelsolin n=1 Tax=Dunaliella salina TaxID=3046 RepID=A0ABQ7H9N9_DUNSA|nr:actin-binding protein gelsolin [Dunaliella salina]|eukprot:KAF5843571.1 actin-binding protein gelsolin [Dunaliella salina]